MRKSLFLVLAAFALCSHDLYVKMDTYFLRPQTQTRLSLYNGTFEKSENTITRNRMSDASMVSSGIRQAINPEQWTDQDSTITQLSFTTGAPGTYVAGVATLPRTLSMTAAKFNDYLAHDGVVDMLYMRREQNLLDQDATEQYEKNVKAIFQVGDTRTEDWKTVLGYPIEFVPVTNPYDAQTGETLDIQLLLDGQPLSNQLVIAQNLSTGHEHSHTRGDHSHNTEGGHTHTQGQQLRTNEQGIVAIELPKDGIYYLRTIHMETVETGNLTHKSKWATLAFEVTHAHNATTHTHDHEHHAGVPSYVFWVGSVLLIGVLFVGFKKQKAHD